MDADQLPFEFPSVHRPLPARLWVVLRYHEAPRVDGLPIEAYWLEQGLHCWFRSWPEALASVFHELNDHVWARIREE